MTNDIFVAAGGIVTIDTDEYRRLVERSAYLNVILAFANDPKAYILSDITCVVGDLLKKAVITAEDDGQSADIAPEGEDTHA